MSCASIRRLMSGRHTSPRWTSPAPRRHHDRSSTMRPRSLPKPRRRRRLRALALPVAATVGVLGLTGGLAVAGELAGPAQRQASRLARAVGWEIPESSGRSNNRPDTRPRGNPAPPAPASSSPAVSRANRDRDVRPEPVRNRGHQTPFLVQRGRQVRPHRRRGTPVRPFLVQRGRQVRPHRRGKIRCRRARGATGPRPSPGKSGAAPGHSGSTPGRSGATPGNSGNAPGHNKG